MLTDIKISQKFIDFGADAQPIIQAFSDLCDKYEVKNGAKIIIKDGTAYMITDVK